MSTGRPLDGPLFDGRTVNHDEPDQSRATHDEVCHVHGDRACDGRGDHCHCPVASKYSPFVYVHRADLLVWFGNAEPVRPPKFEAPIEDRN